MKVFFIFLLSICFAINAQTCDKNGFYFRGTYNFGTILQQHKNTTVLVNNFINGFELNYIKPSSGKKLWQYENNLPEYGVGVTYFNLNNPKELGDIYAAYFFYDIPLRKKEKAFRLHMRLASGIAYAPVHFDPAKNNNNRLISISLNACANFKWFFRWNLGKKICWELGLNYTHVSNGNSNFPNLGANMITLNSGFIYKFTKPRENTIIKIDSGIYSTTKYEILLWAGGGIIQENLMRKRCLAQSYSASFYHNIRNTQKIGAGIDIYYNAGNIQVMKENGVTLPNNAQNIQVGVKIAYAYNMGRLSIPIEMGYYLFSKYMGEGYFFHRIGMRYSFKNNFIALITLKTNWIVANYLEFGFGYRIRVGKTALPEKNTRI